ncbi:MAG: hypothetical protein J6U40_07010 [Kiritimatiellae bacterium]|nr:hypothetical protein [Kiritimatiellia bacterium]
MANLIQTSIIPDGAVYGVRQVQYTVNNETGKDYATALAASSFKEAIAIEASASASAEVVRQRQRKVSDLGDVLAVLASALATMDPKSNDTDKRSSTTHALYEAWQTARQYGIIFDVSSNSSMQVANISYANATKAQNNVQYALDVEDNDLQQDMVTLQSLVSKRDNAFSAAAKLIRKSVNTASGTISNLRN